MSILEEIQRKVFTKYIVEKAFVTLLFTKKRE